MEVDGEPGVPVELMLDSLPGRDVRESSGTRRAGRNDRDPDRLVHARRRRCGFGGRSRDRHADTAEYLVSGRRRVAGVRVASQLGMRGKAKLYTGWQPLGRRVFRFVTRTFHFEF